MCPQEKIGVVNFSTYMFNETPSNRERGIERENQAGDDLENEIRTATPYKTLSIPFNSNQLFKWNRFDLPIKNMFLKFYDKNINSNFGEEMYKEHLKLWNGFIIILIKILLKHLKMILLIFLMISKLINLIGVDPL